MNVVTYRGDKPEIVSDPNFALVVELLSKQLDVLKHFGTSAAVVSAGTKLTLESDHERTENRPTTEAKASL